MDNTSKKQKCSIKKTLFRKYFDKFTKKTKLIDTDSGKEFFNNIFQDLLYKNSIKTYSRNTSLGAVLSERFNRRIRDLLKKPVFEKCDGNWIDVLSITTTQYIDRVHTSTKLTPLRASFKKN